MNLAPGFLIAFPHLLDANFRQSVVLLLESNDDGAMGLVVNHETPLLLEELCRDHKISYAGRADKRVRRGGPVQPDQGLVLFGAEIDDPDARPVQDGLQISASRETLVRLCGEDAPRFHCYAGYAGWGPGQLERELGQGTWVVGPSDPALVLDVPPERIWEDALRAQGIDPVALVPGGGSEA